MAAPAVMGAVLAGGSGSRMGRPKADVELRGRPLISYPLAALEQAGIEAIVVAKRSTPLPELSVPVWHERDEPAHPAVGIVTALQRSASDTVLVVACDMPFLTADLLSYMSSLPDAIAVPYLDGLYQPLLGRYPRVIAPSFAYVLGKDLSLQQIVSDLGPLKLDEEQLGGFGELERLFFNVNTPDDLEKAERWMEE
jgi:molybdopterin-guanine dinucleotide biosynthesis protein A